MSAMSEVTRLMSGTQNRPWSPGRLASPRESARSTRTSKRAARVSSRSSALALLGDHRPAVWSHGSTCDGGLSFQNVRAVGEGEWVSGQVQG